MIKRAWPAILIAFAAAAPGGAAEPLVAAGVDQLSRIETAGFGIEAGSRRSGAGPSLDARRRRRSARRLRPTLTAAAGRGRASA